MPQWLFSDTRIHLSSFIHHFITTIPTLPLCTFQCLKKYSNTVNNYLLKEGVSNHTVYHNIKVMSPFFFTKCMFPVLFCKLHPHVSWFPVFLSLFKPLLTCVSLAISPDYLLLSVSFLHASFFPPLSSCQSSVSHLFHGPVFLCFACVLIMPLSWFFLS